MSDKPMTAEAHNLANGLGHGRGLNGHNINGPSASELANIVAEPANQARESFIGLYLEATGTRIEDTVLCEQHDNGVIRWWCEPKGLRK